MSCVHCVKVTVRLRRMMGIMMPETCCDRSLIISIELDASCWFSLFSISSALGQQIYSAYSLFDCVLFRWRDLVLQL